MTAVCVPTRSKILLIESDGMLADAVSKPLIAEGYEVKRVHDGDAGFFNAMKRKCPLVILNTAVARKNGLQICSELRQAGVDTAILMLTSCCSVKDRVAALKRGADDCLAAPFDPSELLARVEALLRRVEKEERIPVRTFQFADVEMDFERSEIRKGGQTIAMSAKELQLISYLVQNRDRVVTREEALKKVWQYNHDVSSRTLDVHISWLRQKLDHPHNPQHIQTIRGKGYRFTGGPVCVP
jgi:two-component system OmpR family response regulator